jgi:hypothetical protein
MLRYFNAVILCLAIGVGVPALADPPSWASFSEAIITGVYLAPALESDTLSYTISIGDVATIKFGDTTYSLDWIQGFYVLSLDETKTFVATNGANNSWTWEAKPVNGDTFNMAGWHNVGNADRILPGANKTLTYGTFNFSTTDVSMGFHIGYGGGGETAHFKTLDIPVLPEPGSLLALASGVIGLVGLEYRKRRAKSF